MKLGYIRVSTREQNVDRQLQALNDQCDELMIERTSAAATKRPVFEAALERLEPGDTFVILDLDRAFRSTVDAILTAERLRENNVSLMIVNADIDTSSEWGEVIYGVMAVLAQFERKMIRRRTKEGLEAARRAGRKLGPKYKLTKEQLAHARRLIDDGQETVASMARTYGVHRSTLGRRLQA